MFVDRKADAKHEARSVQNGLSTLGKLFALHESDGFRLCYHTRFLRPPGENPDWRALSKP